MIISFLPSTKISYSYMKSSKKRVQVFAVKAMLVLTSKHSHRRILQYYHENIDKEVQFSMAET